MRAAAPVTISSGGNRVRYTIPEEDVVEFDVQAGQTYDLAVRVSTGQQ